MSEMIILPYLPDVNRCPSFRVVCVDCGCYVNKKDVLRGYERSMNGSVKVVFYHFVNGSRCGQVFISR